ncbi:hypothetical protein G7Z17_g12554 [Cylindrodendrum hubeiense]|uniref:mitogen-activated protein kinase n=1 Tax=Cylindrodendrum hubeiense TaxID=595255 RepID=A0A9P5GXG7_9HYPO|nr:hypothetical protein G7Z17_g12554 [Cylindrodendrum hubeiense]
MLPRLALTPPKGDFVLYAESEASKKALLDQKSKSDTSDRGNPSFPKLRDDCTSIQVFVPKQMVDLTLITLGRQGKLRIDHSEVADIQCSLEIHRLTGEILLYDRSENASTKLFGPTATRFQGPLRRVVVNNMTNLHFGFGGSNGDLFKWLILWTNTPPFPLRNGVPRGPTGVLPRTIWELPEGFVPSLTLHEMSSHQAMSVIERRHIGFGPASRVFEALDLGSGGYVAVKELSLSARPDAFRSDFAQLVRLFGQRSHRHIVEFIGAQIDNTKLQIITTLKAGNINDLCGYFREDYDRVIPLLRQILQALEYLASLGFGHGEVCPENILYTKLPEGSYQYQLSGFNSILTRSSAAARSWHRAPEVLNNPRRRNRTHKSDIWSLFATIVFALDFKSILGVFELPTFIGVPQAIQERAAQLSNHIRATALRGISFQDMAELSPDDRPTAAELLRRLS